MNKDKTRALRRHHRERLMHSRSHDTFSGTTEQQLSKHVSTPTKCSCWMCGNPRKYYGNSEEARMTHPYYRYFNDDPYDEYNN